MKESILVLALALFSEVVVPRVAQWTAPPEPEAEAEVEEADSSELERLRAENALLKDIVVEKELALREAEEGEDEES